MPLSFPELLAAIVVIGVVHILLGHRKDKAVQRRSRDAILRLDSRTWKDPD